MHKTNTGTEDIMKAYYKMIGNAHIDNIEDEILSSKEEIDSISIPDSMDEWFESFHKNRRRKEKRQKFLKQMKKISLKVAVFAGILLAVMTVVTMTVEAFRVRVFNLILTDNNTYTEFDFSEDDSNQTIPDIDLNSFYYLSYLPIGYYYKDCSVVGTSVTIEYKNGDNIITFDQDKAGTSYQIDTENAEITEITIGEYEGKLITKSDRSMLIWTEEDNIFVLFGKISGNELKLMAESKKIKEKNN